MLRRRSLHSLLVAGTLLVSAAPANAYVRTRTTDTNLPLYWTQPRATLELAMPPEAFSVTLLDFQDAAIAAARTWSFPSLECSAVDLQVAPSFVEDQSVAFDGHNRIVIRTNAWCRDPVALTNCHDPSLIAVTTVFSRHNPGVYNDGEILEGDIEINSVNFTWSVIPAGEGEARDFLNDYDLASALTHETGHFLGFAHTCMVAGEAQRFDDQGVPSPLCTQVVAGPIGDATMYPFIEPAEIRDRALSPDDLSAACKTYNVASHPAAGMCQVGGVSGGHDLGGWLGVLALLGGLFMRAERPVQSVARAATLRKDS